MPEVENRRSRSKGRLGFVEFPFEPSIAVSEIKLADDSSTFSS